MRDKTEWSEEAYFLPIWWLIRQQFLQVRVNATEGHADTSHWVLEVPFSNKAIA